MPFFSSSNHLCLSSGHLIEAIKKMNQILAKELERRDAKLKKIIVKQTDRLD